MENLRGQYFTPAKKGELISQVEGEIKLLDQTISGGNLGEVSMQLLRDNRQKLQDILNGLFGKKGVVTPAETDSVLDSISDAKRARLQKDYAKTMRNAVIYLIGFGLVAAGIYFYIKKRGK
jgi:hypothetical protein